LDGRFLGIVLFTVIFTAEQHHGEDHGV